MYPVFVFVLILIVSTVITVTPVSALYPTVARLSITPDIVGVGQEILINAWTSPQPPLIAAGTTQGRPRTGYMLTFTKPDGTTETKGPFTSDGPGTMWTTYVPDKIGKWSVKFSWSGDEIYEGSETTAQFTVQQESLPPYPEAELPSGYWTRPITAENREWYNLSGSWLYSRNHRSGYDASGSDFNPYSKAPNTAHILWLRPVWGGGLMGGVNPRYVTGEMTGEGTSWSQSSMSHYGDVITIIVEGKVYYAYQDELHCIDLRTGEELWVKPVSGVSTLQGQLTPMGPYILSIGSKFQRFDAFTGNQLLSLTGGMSGTFADPYVYSIQTKGDKRYLVKWTSAGVVSPPNLQEVDWDVEMDKRIIYNVTLGDSDHPFGISYIWNDIGVGSYTRWSAGATIADNPVINAINLTTGELMWNVSTGTMGYVGSGGCVGYGKYYYPNYLDMRWHAVDLYTGQEVWVSDPAEEPWGTWWAYGSAIAYGKVYASCHDGHVYAYDVDTGKTVWKFYTGDAGSETPYGHWVVWGPCAVADGKVYASAGEHSPNNPASRGYRLYCLDANTGTELWSLPFTGAECKCIADGALTATNIYDGQLYCFDKGLTVTTVSAPQIAVPKGTEVLITGTVMDMSPAKPNTPAIADEDMSAWMEYLHMQRPKPTNAKGVLIKLTAVDQDGKSVDVGVTNSDASGFYSLIWMPPAQGKYTITATFEGSESYWASSAETAIYIAASSPVVVPSSSSSVSPTSTVSPSVVPQAQAVPATELYIAIAAVIIIAVVVAVAMLLRRRK